jgi:hypothetical protein
MQSSWAETAVLLQCAVGLRYMHAFDHEKTISRRRSGCPRLERKKAARKCFQKSFDIDYLSLNVVVISNTLPNDDRRKKQPDPVASITRQKNISRRPIKSFEPVPERRSCYIGRLGQIKERREHLAMSKKSYSVGVPDVSVKEAHGSSWAHGQFSESPYAAGGPSVT